jgi:LPS sulfotransferase NodH
MQEYIKKKLFRLSNLYKRLVKKVHSIQEVIKSTLVLPLHFAQQHILIPAISLMKAFVGKKAFSLPKRKNKKTYNFHAIKKTFKKLEYFLEKGFKFLTIVFTKFTALIVFCTHYFLKIVRKFMRFFVMALYGISQVVLFIAALLWLSLQLTYQVILENVLVKNEDLK